MANYRQIHVKLWAKDWFELCDSGQKLLFIYLVTNPHRNESGLYELSKRRMMMDTGLTESGIDKSLDGLESIKRVYWRSGWVFVANIVKYGNLNDKGVLSVQRDFQSCPVIELKNEFAWRYAEQLGIDWSFTSTEKPIEAKAVVTQEIQEEKPLDPITKWLVESRFDNVLRLKKQLTSSESEKLVARWDKAAIRKTLEAMENKKDLTKKYQSVYLTLNGWLSRDDKAVKLPMRPKRDNGVSGNAIVDGLVKNVVPHPEWKEVEVWWLKQPTKERERVKSILIASSSEDPHATEKLKGMNAAESFVNVVVRSYISGYYQENVWKFRAGTKT